MSRMLYTSQDWMHFEIAMLQVYGQGLVNDLSKLVHLILQMGLVRELQEQLAAAQTAQGTLQQDSKAQQLDVVHLKGHLETACGDRDRSQDQLKSAPSNAVLEGSLEQALTDIKEIQQSFRLPWVTATTTRASCRQQKQSSVVLWQCINQATT